MNKIRLHRDDLETMLRIVDQLNPAADHPGGLERPGIDFTAGRCTITEDNSSGIGSIISIEVPVDINGLSGTFRKIIIDEKSW